MVDVAFVAKKVSFTNVAVHIPAFVKQTIFGLYHLASHACRYASMLKLIPVTLVALVAPVVLSKEA